jgi:transposase
LAGDTARAATSGEVKDLRREASALKEVVADLTLENRLLKNGPPARGFYGVLSSLRQLYGLMGMPMTKMDIRAFRAP